MARVNQSILKALEILEILSGAERGMRLKELAEQASYPPSTTHRLVSSLVEGNYVEQDPHTGHYYLGTKILSLQAEAIRGRHIGRSALPHLLRLKQQANGTINLGVLSGNGIVYLESLVPDTMFSFYVPPGSRAPIHCTAMGKLLLAYQPAQVQEATLSSLELRRYTDRTIASIATLQAELAEIAKMGYAVDDEEYVRGVRCVAAPVRDHTAQVVAAVSNTAVADELPPERIKVVAALLGQAGLDISASLGFTGGAA